MKNFSFLLTFFILLGLDLYAFLLLVIASLQDVWLGRITLDLVGLVMTFAGITCLIVNLILSK